MLPSMDSSTDKPTSSNFRRVARYIIFRALVLIAVIAVGIFLAIVIINYGGYIDKIHRADIGEALNFVSLSMPSATKEEIVQATEEFRIALEKSYGLNQPFLLRCVRWWYQAITFDWGVSYGIGLDRFRSSKPIPITQVVLSKVPYTLLLAGATNILLFFASMFVALNLSKKYGSLWDRLLIAISPLSAIPNWVYGIILTVIFAGELHLLPFNGLYDTFPPATKLGYVPIVLKHMILPVSAIFLGMFFSTVYTWRTFFLIHSGEDYLEMAKAKGLPARIIDRRYVLKPTLPYIITSFTILILTFWQGIIVLELFFDWPGLGQLFMISIASQEMSITIGIVVVFALLLGLSVFLLDIVYAIVDPRVKISTNEQSVKPIMPKSLGSRIGSYLKSLRRSNSSQSIAESAGRKVIDPAGRYVSNHSMPVRNAKRSLAPLLSSQTSGTSRRVIPGYCPYLRLEINRGQVLQVASQRCRCYVHGHPERIGVTYQAEICRTQAYRQCSRLLAITGHQRWAGAQSIPSPQGKVSPQKTRGVYSSFGELFRYPMAVAGILIILVLIGVSIYTMIAIPYKEAIQRWSPLTVDKYHIPKNAMPVWVNWFRKDPLPPTIIQNSALGEASKVYTPGDWGGRDEAITFTIDYPYGGFPQDMVIIFNGQYKKKPFVSLTWTTPDGREFKLGNFSVVSTQRFLATEDIPPKYFEGQIVQRQGILLSGVSGPPAVQILFKDPSVAEPSIPLQGTYSLRIDTTVFEPDANLDAELIFYGQVYGLAGTDDLRRDLMTALLWGTPVALAFGFLGAISTGLLAMLISAVGVWYGGWVDSVIQRITEVNMILPTLPIAIMIYYLYSKSIWMILGVIILLSIFGSAIKTYRAAFLQVKELPYIEAAQAYGASNWRIIRQYLVPRIIPLLIPQLVIMVPSYVFFEATLAFLNISDPLLPTWGKVVYDSLTRGAFNGQYYWVLEPVALMILTGLAFAVVGFALDSILNPRLRRI